MTVRHAPGGCDGVEWASQRHRVCQFGMIRTIFLLSIYELMHAHARDVKEISINGSRNNANNDH